MKKRPLLRTAVLVAVAASLCLAACGGADSSDGETITLVGFAVPKAANDAAAEAWAETEEGRGVRFEASYGASGDQSRAVEAGKKADYVHFSVGGDVTRLVDAGLVDEDWDDGPNKGIVSQSVVVLVVRKGNPKGITGWDDLVRDDISIVTPNPGSSGAARWNLMAAWAHATDAGAKPDSEGEAYLEKFFANVTVLAGSGREATTAFTNGDADVLISYENEAIFARQNGEDFEYFIPDTTLLIENPGAVTKNAGPKARQWLEFVLSPKGQEAFALKGFRPVVDGVEVEVEGANDPSNPFPAPERLVTVADFGGWKEINKKFFATAAKDGADGLVTKIQDASGKGN